MFGIGKVVVNASWSPSSSLTMPVQKASVEVGLTLSLSHWSYAVPMTAPWVSLTRPVPPKLAPTALATAPSSLVPVKSRVIDGTPSAR